MARMFPTTPRLDTDSQAELDLFDVFDQKLSDSYLVLHSVVWQLRGEVGGSPDGETDFVILCPEYGLLILEVKGGRIRYNGPKDEWFSGSSRIKDPFRQVRRAKYSLLAKLKETPLWRDRWINIGTAVAFPDVSVDSDLRLDAPRSLILDVSDKSDVASWLSRALDFVARSDSRSSELDSDAIQSLQGLLAPSWDLNAQLAAELEAQGKTMARLTESQYAILDYLQHRRRAAIAGCAGSGKTFVAIEKSIRLDREGFRVLLLCHNPSLARLLMKRVSDTGVEATDFGSWVDMLVTGEKHPADWWTHYAEPTDDELSATFDKLLEAESKYDAVIVDEGQDFREEWWIVVEAALEENGILYVFHDDNQALLPLRSTYPMAQAPYVLSRNCRNMGAVFDVVRRFHPQAPEPSLELANGGNVRLFAYADDPLEGVESALLDALDLLPPESLLLLTTESEPVEQSMLSQLQFAVPNPLAWRHAVESCLRRVSERFPYSSTDLPSLSYNPFAPTYTDAFKVTKFAESLHFHTHTRRVLGPSRTVPTWIQWAVDVKGGSISQTIEISTWLSSRCFHRPTGPTVSQSPERSEWSPMVHVQELMISHCGPRLLSRASNRMVSFCLQDLEKICLHICTWVYQELDSY